MKSTWKKGIAAAALATSVLAAGGPAYAADYTLTDLYNLSAANYTNYAFTSNGRPSNRAFSINDNGQIVGIFKGQFTVDGRSQSQTHFVSWDSVGSGYTATDLGIPYMGTNYNTTPNDINRSGQIVGSTLWTSSKPHGWIYNSSSSTVDLWSNKLSGMTQTTPTSINDSGVVVGYAGDSYSYGAYPYNTAFIYDGSKSSSLVRIPGATQGTGATAYSAATGINNNGLVTGYSTVGGIAQAFIYDSAKGDATGFQSLGTLGGLANSTSNGLGINDAGNVIGYSTAANGIQHAFLYTKADGTILDLGALLGDGKISQANAISNNGVVVGKYNFGTDNNNPIYHAFIYRDGVATDLNTLIDSPDFTLVEATGINSLGQIVGYGTVTVNLNGSDLLQERAFALSPTPTPIPPAVLLFGSGLAGLGYFRRRAKKVQ